MTRTGATREAQRRANALGKPFNVFADGRNHTDFIVLSTERAWPKGWVFINVFTPDAEPNEDRLGFGIEPETRD